MRNTLCFEDDEQSGIKIVEFFKDGKLNTSYDKAHTVIVWEK